MNKLDNLKIGWKYEGEFYSDTSLEIIDTPDKELIMISDHLVECETHFFVIIPFSNLRKSSIYLYKDLGSHSNDSYFRITYSNTGKISIHFGYKYAQGSLSTYSLGAKVYVYYR